ncbi:Head domain of trimeric autotransporter adhesin [Paraburkholderia steynii]|uniref:Head domain of trimeric autotransporter adhesin n=1 Tax=Paraburkholderia steynii TaxID=1245441 RepID=A0A7Z7B0F6_9BURK|nr:ESPR-type extended signal peptide-containing protein [Paraburkholderia steynii]SDG98392.1 Head domain of trimeric autotransporter adhesin [Paraburkholderia steynii]
MNKTYRNVWCAKTGTFIAAAETARAKGKSARSGMRALTCATLLTLGGVAGAAHAGALDGGSTLSGIGADIAYGSGAYTTNAAGGKAAVAIGQNASANNLSGATPNADGTVAVGDSASATDGGVAVGGASYAGTMSTAVGAGATAATANSVALGANSVANSTMLGTAGFAPVGGTAISAATAAGEVSIGKAGAERRITNVAAGLNPTDAVNVSQLMSEDAKVNNISSNVSDISRYFKSSGLKDGSDAATLTGGGVAIGAFSKSTGPADIAIGKNAVADSAAVAGTNSENSAMAMGYGATAAVSSATAVGLGSTVQAASGQAFGRFSWVKSGATATALGGRATVDANNSVALGAMSYADRANTVSVGAATSHTDVTGSVFGPQTRQIVNMAAGSQANDAVNVSQLTPVVNALGGGAAIDGTTGAVTGPTYVVNGSTINNVGGAISNIDARTTQNASDISNIDARTTQNSSDITNLTTAINNGEFGLVQQDATTRDITVAKTTDGTIVDFTGTAGARKLTGVLAGNVNASSVDAVNGSQLFNFASSTASAIGGGSTVNSDGSISKPSYVIGGATVNSIGGAITNIDARTTQLANDVTNLTTSINNGGLGLVEQDATTRNITVAKATDGAIVDFSGTAGTRKLTGVFAGDVSASSADAVNGSQLYSLANSTASAIGGGATVNSNGSISMPSFVIGGTTVNSIGGAITNIDARTTQNASDISSINTALSNFTISGASNKYFHTNSMLADSQATGSDSVAIGGAAVATGVNSVALGSNSTADRANSVSVGSVGAERQITNVAAGTADTDAVNVAQMNSALANVTNIAMNAASGSPTFATNGDGSTAAAKATGHHATAMGSNAQASADNSVALGADSVADRENTVSVGSKGHERQIINVAAGTQGTDAVNVDQLNETVAGAVGNLPAGMSAKDYTDQRFSSMQNTVDQVAKNSYAGVAAAMAMPNMTPSQPGNTVVAAGAGSYKSGAALGVGATYRSRNSKWLVNGAVSVTSTGDAGVRAQVGYEF